MLAFVTPVAMLNLLAKKFTNAVFNPELCELERKFSLIMIQADDERFIFVGGEAKVVLDLDRWEGGYDEPPAHIVRIAKNSHNEYFYIVLQHGASEVYVNHIPRQRAQLILQEHPAIFSREFELEVYI